MSCVVTMSGTTGVLENVSLMLSVLRQSCFPCTKSTLPSALRPNVNVLPSCLPTTFIVLEKAIEAPTRRPKSQPSFFLSSLRTAS